MIRFALFVFISLFVTQVFAQTPPTKNPILQNLPKDIVPNVDIRQLPSSVPSFEDLKIRFANNLAFNGSNFEALPWQGSVMFRDEDLTALYEAVKKQLPFSASQGEVGIEVVTPSVAPAFYLNSVLYNSPKNWTIWLNNRRIRAGAKFPKLEISRIKADKVEFIWETADIDFISPGWAEKVPSIPTKQRKAYGKWAYKSPAGDIFVDETKQFVRFILSPHQTFVSRTMRIAEGRHKSTFLQQVTNGQPQLTTAPNTGPNTLGVGEPMQLPATSLPAQPGAGSPASIGVPAAAPAAARVATPAGMPATTALPPVTPLPPVPNMPATPAPTPNLAPPAMPPAGNF